MKRVVGLWVALILAVSCQKKDAHLESMEMLAEYETTIPQLAHANVRVPTVQCGACLRIIRNSLAGTPGFLTIHIDFRSKSAHINFDAEQVSLSEIEHLIAGSGYQANNVHADLNAYAKIPECCKIGSHSGL